VTGEPKEIHDGGFDAIEMVFTPVTGRVNISCAVHPWWGRDQIRPTYGAIREAVAVHATLEHGQEASP
jgi:hypothetical protein